MVEIVVPEMEKPVLEIQTAVNERQDDEEFQRFGLKIIQDGEQVTSPDDASSSGTPLVPYDVVLIHGIYGTGEDSWTKGSDTIWINNALVAASESKGRIMSYSYQTDIETGRYYTPYGVYQEAEALLEALRKLRTSEITGIRRPIHFFSHDVGGTIVKAALAMATDHEDKYADILHCTRAMYFFGYPHRYPSIGLLEEAVLRLVAQKRHLWSGNMVWYAKSLTKTITKVNDAFLGTQMLTQANFINVVSNLHLDPAEQVFPLCMSTMATPFERVVKMEKPNSDLILAGEDGVHPVNDIPDADWLMGSLTDEQHVAFRKMINQASPVLPYHKLDEGWQNSDLLELPKRKETLITHMRCSSGAKAATENASFFLDNNRSGTFHPLLYMKFDAHDIRFNNCDAMLRTFLGRIVCNRLQTGSFVQRPMDTLIRAEALHRSALFDELESLQGVKDFQQGIHVLGCFDECDESAIWFLSEIHKLLLRSEHCLKLLITTTKGTPGDQRITTALSEFPAEHIRKIDHDPKEPVPFSVETEASKLMKKFGEYVGTDHDRDVLSALCSCADDHDLCELVLEWLGSDTKELKRIQWLHNKTLTPALIFAEILDGMAEMQRPWAKILLSWLLTCYRPLRCDELCRVSDIVWLQVEGGKTTPPVLSEIIRNFGGLITSTNGEIRFRHPNTRTWLESHSSSAGEMTWYYTTETRSHEGILQTCVSYFQEAAERPEYAAQRLPYAIEFWSKHWQQVDTSEKQLLDLFENDSVFQFWAQSLFAMPNTQLKPPSTHIKPLPVAAHLGLVAVVETLLERNQDQAESRGQALIEACRAGHVAVIRLLMNSYSDDLDFSDENLHEAARVASHSGNDEALRELVSKLPKPPCTLSSEESKTEESEQSVKASENAQANDLPDDSLNGASRGEDDAEGILPEERVPGPLEWLVKPMYRAAGSGMDDVVTRLLQLGVDPNPPENTTPNSNSFIYTAVNNSHISCAKLLMHAGASLTAKNAQGHTALHTATEWASGETVEFLLEQGASIGDEAPGNHRTALNMAAIWGSFTALEAILSRKDAVESLVHDSDRHPVNQAVDNENKKCLKLLLSHGFSPNNVTSTGETALRTAIQNGRLDLCKMLIENNADPDLTPDGANTPLIQAISKGDLDIVKLLIENKATVDKREAPPYEGWSRTPMQAAVDWSRPEIVQYLLGKGADPDARDSDDIPVIGAAISGGHTNMVQWLAEANADLNVTYYESKSTPLHEATPYPEMVRLLLQHGADISKGNADSRTALNLAISANNLATVQILLESKTKPDLGAATIQLDLRIVAIAGYTEVVEALLEAGADVNNVNEDGESLLAYAVKNNAPSGMIRKILEYNPDLEMRDKKQNTALHCVNSSTTLETVRLLINAGGKLDVLNSDKDTPLIVAIGPQLDDIFFYMLKKEPSLLTQSFITSQQRVTPLHEACRLGSLAMVRSLIEHEMDVNSCCEGVYGTPLISATLRRGLLSSPLASDIIALLLVNGASPRTTGGLFQYPLISACLACPADTIRLLLNSNASPQDQDSWNRKAVHLACYNSLEVLNLLEIPDSDFAAADELGRVPLHYAVMTGDVELVQAVLERSQRVGAGIDVRDDDGWTPLLWAARAARIWNRQLETESPSTDMVSFLLKHGADPTIKGYGVDRDWTVCEVAYYHQADFVESLIDRPSTEKTRSRKRGSAPGSQDNGNIYCDCCLIESHGIYFNCSLCFDFSLCFKCYRAADKIHPDHSSFVQRGSEWDEDDTSKEEDAGEMNVNDGGGDEDVLMDFEEIPYEEFDSEVSD